MSQPLTANCIRSAFTLRVIVSVVFPIGGANDMWVGILSMTTTGALFHGGSAPGNLPPLSVLATTLIQGFYLNVEVFLVALILFGLSKAWHAVAG